MAQAEEAAARRPAERWFDPEWQRLTRSGPARVSQRRALVDLALRHIDPTGEILVAGAGDGALLQDLQAALPQARLVAQDGVPEAQALLTALEPAPELLRGRLGGERLLPAERFDCVVAAGLLDAVEEDGRALDDLVASVKPGGVLLLSAQEGPERWTYLDVTVGRRRRYQPGALAELCRKRGLEVIDDRSTGAWVHKIYSGLLAHRDLWADGERLESSLPLRGLERLLGAALSVEARVPSRRGGTRGFVVARHSLR